MTPLSIFVSEERCIKCGQCVRACPANIFTVAADLSSAPLETLPEVENIDACIRCGHCVAVCPTDAVQHSGFRTVTDPSEFSAAKSITTGGGVISPLPEEGQEMTWEQFQTLVRSRRSVRIFQEKAVERDMLAKIVETGQVAPSATNRRGTFWTVVTKPAVLQQITALTTEFLEQSCQRLRSAPARLLAVCRPNSEAAVYRSRLPMMEALLKIAKKRDVILHGAPALLIAHYDPKDGRFADIDAQLAIQNATLAAVALHLGTFYTGFVTRAADTDPRIEKALSIPPHHKIAGGMVVGHPAVKYRYSIHREYPSVMWIE